jgi:hypothetical protein
MSIYKEENERIERIMYVAQVMKNVNCLSYVSPNTHNNLGRS